MSSPGSSHLPVADRIRALVADADRRRRSREIARHVWHAAPVVAGVSLAGAILRFWAGWSSILPLSVLGVGAMALAAYGWTGRRARQVTDPMAARVDADARLSGELRSASWFAASGADDSWAQFHMDAAVVRAEATDWRELYPPLRVPRLWTATGLMALAAVALSVSPPARAILNAGSLSQAQSARGKSNNAPIVLPPELQKKLDELLAGVEMGTLPPAEAAAQAGDLKDLLAKLGKPIDPELMKKLQQAVEAGKLSGKPIDPASLAERAKQAAADPSTPDELRKALEDLANELGKMSDQQSERAAGQQPENGNQQASQQGPSVQAGETGDPTNSTMQFSRDSAGAGTSQAMMLNAGAMSNDPRPGEGGNQNNGDPSAMADVSQALRHETIEASSDMAGDNVTAEQRRKTEQGHAGAGFTHGAAAKFDRAHSSAPPPVPESRRTQVQNYFIRKQ